jgi:hypothetical protein
MTMHNPEKFTFWSDSPKETSCGLRVSDYPKEKLDVLGEDARGDKARTRLVTCEACRTQMRRGWFLRWLLD